MFGGLLCSFCKGVQLHVKFISTDCVSVHNQFDCDSTGLHPACYGQQSNLAEKQRRQKDRTPGNFNQHNTSSNIVICISDLIWCDDNSHTIHSLLEKNPSNYLNSTWVEPWSVKCPVPLGLPLPIMHCLSLGPDDDSHNRQGKDCPGAVKNHCHSHYQSLSISTNFKIDMMSHLGKPLSRHGSRTNFNVLNHVPIFSQTQRSHTAALVCF